MDKPITINQLSPELISKIQQCHYDNIVEKHEGPFSWAYSIKPEWPTIPGYSFPERDDAEFMVIDGYSVLLPVGQKQHANITIPVHTFGRWPNPHSVS